MYTSYKSLGPSANFVKKQKNKKKQRSGNHNKQIYMWLIFDEVLTKNSWKHLGTKAGNISHKDEENSMIKQEVSHCSTHAVSFKIVKKIPKTCQNPRPLTSNLTRALKDWGILKYLRGNIILPYEVKKLKFQSFPKLENYESCLSVQRIFHTKIPKLHIQMNCWNELTRICT